MVNHHETTIWEIPYLDRGSSQDLQVVNTKSAWTGKKFKHQFSIQAGNNTRVLGILLFRLFRLKIHEELKVYGLFTSI